MRAATHLRLACLGALVWVAFWLAGLPDYYRQYSFQAMLVFSIALVPAIAFVAWTRRAAPASQAQPIWQTPWARLFGECAAARPEKQIERCRWLVGG